MKLTNIKVNKLFGVFDHNIPFNTDEHITIIHGSNGIGKTTLLNMIYLFFNHNFIGLSEIPFEEMLVEFDDGSKIDVNKRLSEELYTINTLYINYQHEGVHEEYIPYDLNNAENPQFPLHIIESLIPALDRVGKQKWRHSPSGDILSLNQVILKFGEYLPRDIQTYVRLPEWLQKMSEDNPIQFIKTDRLTANKIEQENLRRPISDKNYVEHSVTAYSKELSREIKTKLANYGTLSQSLDRTFPVRLVRLKHTDELSSRELLEQLNKLETKRKQLIDLGLLDNNTEPDFSVSNEEIDDRTRSVLSIYVRDTEEKLNVFNDLAAKIDLLKRIVKFRFRNKEMIVDKEEGILFFTSAGKKLQPMSLSSGEQHQIVLLYDMLFNIKKNSLILIDEPELSLHVAWQVEFLNDLHRITQVVPFDVLIATHSPQIINDRWDLTLPLGNDDDVSFDEFTHEIEWGETEDFFNDDDWIKLSGYSEDLFK